MSHHAARFLCLTFAVALYAPLVASLLAPHPDVMEEELRPRQAVLSLSDVANRSEYTARLDSAFSDHMGFRDDLIRLHGLIHYVLLGDTPNSRVRVGRDGWVFLSGPDNEITAYRATTPESAPRRAGNWRNVLLRVDRWCRARSKTFVFVMAPNKETVYPEFLPWHSPRARPPTIADALFARLRGDGVAFVDPRSALRDAARKRRVYLKTDTHWNGHGAEVASRQVLATIARATEHSTPRLDVERTTRWGTGDLGTAMHLTGAVSEAMVEARSRGRTTPEIGALGAGAIASVRGRNDGLPATFIYHDSFGQRLRPLLASEFKRTTWRRSQAIDGEEVAASGAEVLVLEVAERFLAWPPAMPQHVELSGRSLTAHGE